ncbi:MAG: FliG C-terminal domain-containing protein [Desulfovibrionaceae bacterium]
MLPFTGGARLQESLNQIAEDVRGLKDELDILRQMMLERERPQSRLEAEWRKLARLLEAVEPEQVAAVLARMREERPWEEYARRLLAVLRIAPPAACPALVDGLGDSVQDDLVAAASVREVPLESLQALADALYAAAGGAGWVPERSRAAAIAGPLACLNPGARGAVLDRLKAQGGEPAEFRRTLLRGFMTFEDLRRADDAGLCALVREATASDLTLALAGAPAELRKRLLGALPERSAALVGQALDETRARESEVRAAQLRLLLTAQRMLEQGRLAFVEDLARG